MTIVKQSYNEFFSFNAAYFAVAQRFLYSTRFGFGLKSYGFKSLVSGHVDGSNDPFPTVHSFFSIFVAKFHFFNILVYFKK